MAKFTIQVQYTIEKDLTLKGKYYILDNTYYAIEDWETNYFYIVCLDKDIDHIKTVQDIKLRGFEDTPLKLWLSKPFGNAKMTLALVLDLGFEVIE